MSKAISVLETELGLKLLRPEGRGIEITPEGLRIYQSSAPLLDEFRRFSSQLKHFANEKTESKLRLGTFEVFSSYFCSALLEKEFPTADALILELSPGNVESAVESGMVEFGLTYLPAPNMKLEFIEIGRFEMGIFGLKRWSQEPFLSWPFAVPTTPLKVNALDHVSLDMWPSFLSRNVKYEFELLETALQTSRAGLSVLHCPDFVVQLQNRHLSSEKRLVRLPSPTGYRIRKEIKIYLIAKKGNIKAKTMERKVAKFLRMMPA